MSSTTLSRRDAAQAFARGENPRTRAALHFQGDVAMSYDEPIAVRVGTALYVTTARFSMTTSHHRGAVDGQWAVENGSETVINTEHGEIRRMARERGVQPGPWGRDFDA